MRFEAVGRSDVGLLRGNNEDAWWADETVVAVSDGVGGRPAGEVASSLAVHVFAEMSHQGVDLVEAAVATSRVVRRLGLGNSLFTGMCCTLSSVVCRPDGLWLLHVGDSKVWSVTGGKAQQVSEDHTLVAQLVRAGELAPEDVKTDPRRHRILQAIGSATAPEPQLTRLDLSPGDRLVLATDGLDYVRDDLALEHMAQTCAPSELADQLLAATLDAGAPDNVTVVVADVLEG